MAALERVFSTDISIDEFENMQSTSKYVVIPPGSTGQELEGDSIYVDVESGVAEWKTQGKSLTVPLTVIQEGINHGKSVEWWAGVSDKIAMNLTKQGVAAFGKTNQVFKKNDTTGKIDINPLGFAGGRARARFVRERSKQGKMSLRSILDSASFLPISTNSEKVSETKDVGI